MNKIALLLVFVGGFYVFSPAQDNVNPPARNAQLLSDTEYQKVLTEIEANLPEWERAIQSVDPAKDNLSYADGKQVDRLKNVGLRQIHDVRYLIQQERIKRHVAKELTLYVILEGMYDNNQSILLTDPKTSAPFERFAPTMGELIAKVGGDTTARVAQLEKRTCP